MTSPELDALIASAEDALDAHADREAAAHSRRVAVAAAEIARAYAVDPQRAFLAGLLHDRAKDMEGGALLREARKRGLSVEAVERDVPYLLHARVGAALARDEAPEVPEDVLLAVARHTVGAPGMSPLDAVLFVADMVEPARSYEGAEELRALVGAVPLEELFLEAYARSVLHVIATRRHLHPETVPTWNAAVDAACEAR